MVPFDCTTDRGEFCLDSSKLSGKIAPVKSLQDSSGDRLMYSTCQALIKYIALARLAKVELE